MLIRKPSSSETLPSELTSETVYQQRRELLKAAGLFGTAAFFSPLLPAEPLVFQPAAERANVPKFLREKVISRRAMVNRTGEVITPFEVVSGYNNFYEFGLDKADPAENAGSLRMEPWSLRVDGECGKPGTYTLEDILKPHAMDHASTQRKR